ncbi:hypothetical protein XB05_19285 [Xanthomonas arboricola]|uniref:DUF2955 domain-containing protein n=1 Tax=Xanthomonas arboricola TaxID=56448 RepID=UPI00061A410A|nr:DUF2955 domain-containing protein [Xanthomonas arboricola]AKC80642.1 hypothetical protein XB05_19285 [Xanthomonas arboricola]
MSTDGLATIHRHALNTNDWQQVKRLTFGTVATFTMSKAFGWNYGLFYAIYPLLLMGLVPFFNAHVARQFLYSALVNITATTLIAGVFIRFPVAMTLLMIVFSALCFWLMSTGRAFLFGAMSLASTHTLVHLASFPDIDVLNLYGNHVWAVLLTVMVSALSYALFPDRARRSAPPRMGKTPSTVRHQILLGTICSTLSFVVFQVFDLRDSLSAQVATILILYPMTWSGSKTASLQRLTGTMVGSVTALLIQLLLYTHYDRLALLVPFYAAAMLLFAAEHTREAAGPARGFGAMTGLAALFGLAAPETDLFNNALYRIGSVTFSVAATMFFIYLTHLALNWFQVTRAERLAPL